MSKKRDELLIIALASGATSARAARDSGYSPATVGRRKRDPQFMLRVSWARGKMIETAAGRLASAAEEAVACLRTLLTDESSSVRLGAARSILESVVRFRELADLQDEMRQIQQQLGITERK